MRVKKRGPESLFVTMTYASRKSQAVAGSLPSGKNVAHLVEASHRPDNTSAVLFRWYAEEEIPLDEFRTMIIEFDEDLRAKLVLPRRISIEWNKRDSQATSQKTLELRDGRHTDVSSIKLTEGGATITVQDRTTDDLTRDEARDFVSIAIGTPVEILLEEIQHIHRGFKHPHA